MMRLLTDLFEPIWKSVVREACESAAREVGQAAGEVVGLYIKAAAGLGPEDCEPPDEIRPA